MKTRYLSLTEDEVLALDQKCRPEIQKEVELVKTARATATAFDEHLPQHLKDCLGRIVSYAIVNKVLKHDGCRWTSYSCTSCKFRPKDILYKSGPRKGQYKESGNHNLHYIAGEYICGDCYSVARKELPAKLQNVEADVLFEGVQRRFVWDYYVTCKSCKHKCTYHQMLPMQAIMGGYYPGKCPNSQCNGESIIFRSHYESHYGEKVLLPLTEIPHADKYF
jgi:hypothetical protein